MPGKNISASNRLYPPQITNVERDGFWILVNNGEFFVPFNRYPDFKTATVAQIFDFRSDGEEFHWDELDIDIDLEALKHPEKYPLVYRR